MTSLLLAVSVGGSWVDVDRGFPESIFTTLGGSPTEGRFPGSDFAATKQLREPATQLTMPMTEQGPDSSQARRCPSTGQVAGCDQVPAAVGDIDRPPSCHVGGEHLPGPVLQAADADGALVGANE